jgi:hypothetical protein
VGLEQPVEARHEYPAGIKSCGSCHPKAQRATRDVMLSGDKRRTRKSAVRGCRAVLPYASEVAMPASSHTYSGLNES